LHATTALLCVSVLDDFATILCASC